MTQDAPPLTLLLAGPFGPLGRSVAARLARTPCHLFLAGGREPDMQALADALQPDSIATIAAIPGELAHPVTRDVLILELEKVDVLILDGSDLGPLPQDDEASDLWRRRLSGLSGLARDLAREMPPHQMRLLALIDDAAGGRVLGASLPEDLHHVALLVSPGSRDDEVCDLLMALLGGAGRVIRSGTTIPTQASPST
ncbi:hypothetical protein JCM17960_27890 [Magnetospira thiophila]